MPAFRNVPTALRNSDRVPMELSHNHDRDLSYYPIHNGLHEHATTTAPSTSAHIYASHIPSYEYYNYIDILPHPDTPATPPASHSSTPRRHSRRREPGYIPRPRNSFIVFRSWWLTNHNASGEGQQNELSKQAALEWRGMTEEDKQPFKDVAIQEQYMHKINYPNYQYAPGPRSSTSRTKTTKPAPQPSGTSASAAPEDTHAPVKNGPNATSSCSVSPSVSPTPVYLPKASRAAAQIAIQRLEQIAMLSSPPPPARSTSPFEEHCFPSYESESSTSTPEYVPTDKIPSLHLEPLFVTEAPPNLATETFDYTLSELNSSNLQYPFVGESTFSADWQPLGYKASEFFYQGSGNVQAPLPLLDEQQPFFDNNLDHWFTVSTGDGVAF